MGAIPILGLGTYGRTGPEGVDAMLAAIDIGYRHIDTAQTYDTEANVGAAMRRSGLPRDAFFVTTKVADGNLGRDRFLPSVVKSLATIGVDQVDLLLIHWPSFGGAVPFEHYMEELALAQQRGLARLIGVSNFTIALLDRAVALLGKDTLATNQVEIHPYLQARRLCAHAKAIGLQLTAYQPLARGAVTDDPVLNGIATRHGSNPSAVALAFLIAEGHIVIPASGSRRHLEQNFAAATVGLDACDIAAIRNLDRGMRVINPAKSPAWDD